MVKRQLEGFLAEPDASLVIVPIVLHELVHVITDSRRFDEPVSIQESIALARLYLDRTNVECVAIDSPSMSSTFELMELHQLGRKRIADTLLVATLLRHGVQELMTCNVADFRVFEELTVLDPRTAPM